MLVLVVPSTQLTCQSCKQTTVVPGPPGGQMLPPIPMVPITTKRVGLFRRRVSEYPTLEACLATQFREERIDDWCVHGRLVAYAWPGGRP